MRLKSILILVGILAIATTVYFATRPVEEPPPIKEPMQYVWLFDMEDLQHIQVDLPHLASTEKFLKHEDRQWYFDDPPGPRADPDRWGGGIPLLLSGPGAERPIAKNATDEQLGVFGFTQPLMLLTLTKEDGEIIRIEVGDEVPDGHAHYVRVSDSNDIYIVDATWYDVLERLVLEPPYPPEEEEQED